MESLDRSRVIQVPLAHRIVLQRTETDITTARFYRIQRERSQMADMDRASGLKKSGSRNITDFHLLTKQRQKDLIREVMIELGAGPRQLSRVSGLSYNVIHYIYKSL